MATIDFNHSYNNFLSQLLSLVVLHLVVQTLFVRKLMGDRFAPVILVTKETDITAQVRINHDLAPKVSCSYC